MKLPEFLENVSSSRASVKYKTFQVFNLVVLRTTAVIYIIELARRALFWQHNSVSLTEN